ncbi:protein PFC0760c [Exaiptasia diaphana]|uniref:Uncharacterized protein n=1 Tax=Exaiptasia diaphana TaxID=2652724 RepID=A0A913X9L9_EXADI|nr:protein PFC0760c [Exaiptasia diaphana]KXJ26774.1 hypothetical protein AC249_AIPGENE26450 [Exaiptasia diaphana]
MTRPLMFSCRILAMNLSVEFVTNNTFTNGTFEDDQTNSSKYIIPLAIALPIVVFIIAMLVLVYCVTQKKQRSVTLTMRRARRMRRMDALHINVEYSDSETNKPRGYTNLCLDVSPDDSTNKDLNSDTEGQTETCDHDNDDVSINHESNHDDDESNESRLVKDHVDNDVNNCEEHMRNKPIVDENGIDEYDKSDEYCEHIGDHVIQYNDFKPQPPTRFDFDTESTTSTDNWAVVCASETDFLTDNINAGNTSKGGDHSPTELATSKRIIDKEDPLSDDNDEQAVNPESVG